MRPMEVVFNEPLGEFRIENIRIGIEIAQLNEFFLERAVEPFVVGIVVGRADSRIVLLDSELEASLFEELFKLGAVVVSHSGNLSVEEIMQPQEKIFSVERGFVFVHPGVSHFSILVDGRENVSFQSVPVDDNSVETDDVAGSFLVPVKRMEVEFGDTLLLLGILAFPSHFSGSPWIPVKFLLFDHLLDFPGGNLFPVAVEIQFFQFHFPVTDLLFSQLHDSFPFGRGDFSLPHMLGRFRFIFQQMESVEIVLVEFPKPLVESFSRDSEMAGGLGSISSLVVVDYPFQAELGGFWKLEDLSHFSPTLVFVHQDEYRRAPKFDSGHEVSLGLTRKFSKIGQFC